MSRFVVLWDSKTDGANCPTITWRRRGAISVCVGIVDVATTATPVQDAWALVRKHWPLAILELIREVPHDWTMNVDQVGNA